MGGLLNSHPASPWQGEELHRGFCAIVPHALSEPVPPTGGGWVGVIAS